VNKVAVSVRLGRGFVGVVWDAVAKQMPALEIIEAPELKGGSELVQIGVLAQSEQATSALQFARYLAAQDRGLEAFAQHHFTPAVGSDAWAERPHITIAAGAMLLPTTKVVFKEFEEREGIKINTVPGGCGVLVAQMKALKAGTGQGNFPDA